MGDPQPRNSRHVILLVEANRSLASLISSVLTNEGYSVLAANTYEEALGLCGEIAGIDLIITDVFLPGASGIDLAGRVKQLNKDVRTLYLSSLSEEDLRKQGIDDEARMIRKPLALSDLASMVNDLLRTK